MRNDEKCRLCNIAAVYSNDKLEYILTDVATGKRIRLDDPSLIGMIRSRMNISYAKEVGTFPVTLLITGDFSHHDEHTIYWNVSPDFNYVFLSDKAYACSIIISEISDKGMKIAIVDRLTGANISINQTEKNQMLMHKIVKQLILSGSSEYYGLKSKNYIIVVGKVHNILNHGIVEMDPEDVILLDGEDFYRQWIEMIKESSGR